MEVIRWSYLRLPRLLLGTWLNSLTSADHNVLSMARVPGEECGFCVLLGNHFQQKLSPSLFSASGEACIGKENSGSISSPSPDAYGVDCLIFRTVRYPACPL